ncbi:hypothetical protein Tco_1455759 [Tanacetum coccineum]
MYKSATMSNIGLDVCVDLTRSSLLTQMGIVDFVSGILRASRHWARAVVYNFSRISFAIARRVGPTYVKLLGGPASADFVFSSELVMKRVAKSIEFMDVVAKINDSQCKFLLLRACAGISKLYFAMRTCPPRVFERAQHSFDAALHFALERIVTASSHVFSDWQWRLSTLPFSFGGGLGIYSTGDVLNYAFLTSRLQVVGLQTKLL